ncbi:MAG: choice-of-anchor J domain-containing protein, partial [Candidatus Symbiothrix sp.]|nr:choice-of-anchor J domain-containing protein [Candidatus Symbiothrix sp.]
TPSIVITPTSYDFGSVNLGENATTEFTVTTANLSAYPIPEMIDNSTPNGAFIIVSGGVLNNGTTTLTIKFEPKEAGNFTKQLKISMDNVIATADLSGVGVGTLVPEKQGDEWPLDPSNPLTILNETFDNVPYNQPFSLPQWKNIAEQNYRAWWGFDFTDDELMNYTAKAVAYNSTNTAAAPYEMWLITPPLDFVNASSKWFTFKVMGDLMSDEDDARLAVYYMYLKNGEVSQSKINFDIPVGSDFNGEWRNMQFDLTESKQNVFFIGFRFSATGGNASAASYYIDDVTYGLPNVSIPEITDDSIKIITVFDLMGRRVDQNNLKRGVYIIQSEENGRIGSRKIMVR